MFRRLFHRFLLTRHFWRYVTLSELRELYLSSMLRTLAFSLVGIFIPIYLYKLHYSIAAIFLFMASMHGVRIVTNMVAGWSVGKVGAKHTILVSYAVQAVALLLLMSLPDMHWPLWIVASLWGTAMSFFFVAYHVDFSAIKHIHREGRELGALKVAEQSGAIAGPVIGGVIASFVGAEYMIMAALVVFSLAALPLLLSKEPPKARQQLRLKSFAFSKVRPHLLSFCSLEVENVVALALWQFFVAIFIFVENTYASVGLVTSLSFAVSIAMTYAIGYVVDTRYSDRLLRMSLVANAGLHALRPFAGGFQGVLALNAVDNAIAPGYRMPYLKGWYDAVDEAGGQRVAFVVVMETAGEVSRGLFWALLALLTWWFEPKTAMIIGFGVGAVASVGIMRHHFAVLRKPSVGILK